MSFVTSFIDEDEGYTICPVCDEYIPIYKEDIKELLEDLEYNYTMVIHYKGFEGRGINGVNNNTMRLKNINANFDASKIIVDTTKIEKIITATK